MCTTKKEKKIRVRGFACDSWWLRREMQDQGLSVGDLLLLIEGCLPELAAKEPRGI